MAVFALSDLHLTFQVEKPMELFGEEWQGYVPRIAENWKSAVSDTDTVLIPGDVSWGTYLEQTVEDFRFIHSLPGIKYISKGNHDYWWETLRKMNGFLAEHSLDSIRFLQNNAFEVPEAVICAAKGFDKDTESRLKERERLRLIQSLTAGKQLNPEKPLVAMLHYPPFFANGDKVTALTDVLEMFGVHTCVFGHVHSKYYSCVRDEVVDGVRYKLVSCNRVDFSPVRLAFAQEL